MNPLQQLTAYATIVIKEISINAPDVIAEFGKFTFNPLKSSESIQ